MIKELENEIKEFEQFLNDYKLPYKKSYDRYSNTLTFVLKYDFHSVYVEKKIVNNKTRLLITLTSDMYNLTRMFNYDTEITTIIDVNNSDKIVVVNNHMDITKYDVNYIEIQFVYLSLYNEKRIRLAF